MIKQEMLKNLIEQADNDRDLGMLREQRRIYMFYSTISFNEFWRFQNFIRVENGKIS